MLHPLPTCLRIHAAIVQKPTDQGKVGLAQRLPGGGARTDIGGHEGTADLVPGSNSGRGPPSWQAAGRPPRSQAPPGSVGDVHPATGARRPHRGRSPLAEPKSGSAEFLHLTEPASPGFPWDSRSGWPC